jgi:hypothetical protein
MTWRSWRPLVATPLAGERLPPGRPGWRLIKPPTRLMIAVDPDGPRFGTPGAVAKTRSTIMKDVMDTLRDQGVTNPWSRDELTSALAERRQQGKDIRRIWKSGTPGRQAKSYSPHFGPPQGREEASLKTGVLVGLRGLEPRTSSLSGKRSNRAEL